jgi:hypothetical protein
MAAEPLPQSRIILEELFDTCSKCLSLVERATQRDLRRANLMYRLADGEITYDELQRHGKVLESALENTRNEYKPRIAVLWPYCDRELVAKARFFLTFGGEAVADGNAWTAQNPYFANMSAAGYALAARGQALHILLLRKLRDELVIAINRLAGAEVEKPIWKGDIGKLMFRGKVVRKVRAGKVATRIRPILDEFQAQNWPDRILVSPEWKCCPQTLREAIATLNEGIVKPDNGFIKFEADGSGHGVICSRG